ncbi:MAG: hypothetical protein CMQ75_01995 [Gammaproteobacteria bacterium]|nr:hypothetical protein [Gammaproteobacteria bacterium]|tara:strand:- start:1341 stop:1667 length:327 start_codon:yes stop_codon:yes gene_type:complete
MRMSELFEDPGDPDSPVTTTQKTVPLDLHRRVVKGYKDQEARTDKFIGRLGKDREAEVKQTSDMYKRMMQNRKDALDTGHVKDQGEVDIGASPRADVGSYMQSQRKRR